MNEYLFVLNIAYDVKDIRKKKGGRHYGKEIRVTGVHTYINIYVFMCVLCIHSYYKHGVQHSAQKELSKICEEKYANKMFNSQNFIELYTHMYVCMSAKYYRRISV